MRDDREPSSTGNVDAGAAEDGEDLLPGLEALLQRNLRGELHEGGPRPGMVVEGKWELRRRLGAGGFGQVYEAWHLRLDQPVAIKFLEARHGGAQMRQRFLEEAQLMAGLTGEHLVRASDYGELPDGTPYFVMSLVRGRTLRHHLAQRMAISRATEVAEGILHGLSELHRRGVTHGDIKPENVIIGDDGEIRVLDFGLAKAEGDDGPHGGTPSYMAPEQVLGGQRPTTRSDVYSVGLVLYEMLAGRLPRGHPGMSMETIRGAWEVRPKTEQIRVHRDGVSDAMEGVLAVALSTEPEKRFGAAEVMLEALAGVTGRESSELATTEGKDGASATARRRGWVAVLGGVLSAGMVAWLVSSSSDNEPEVFARIGLYAPGSSSHADSRKDYSTECWEETSTAIVWRQTKDRDGVLRLAPSSENLQRQSGDGFVAGSFEPGSPIELSVALRNEGEQSIIVSEISATVLSARPLRQPVLSTRSSGGSLVFENHGHVDIVDALLDLYVSPVNDCSAGGLVPIRQKFPIGSFRKIRIEDIYADALTVARPDGRGGMAANLNGTLYYSTSDDSRRRQFSFGLKWREGFDDSHAVALPVSHVYDLVLSESPGDAEQSIAVLHEIKEGETEHVAIRLTSSVSSVYEVEFGIFGIRGHRIATQKAVIAMAGSGRVRENRRVGDWFGRGNGAGSDGVSCVEKEVGRFHCHVDCGLSREWCLCPSKMGMGLTVAPVPEGATPKGGMSVVGTVDPNGIANVLGIQSRDVLFGVSVNGDRVALDSPLSVKAMCPMTRTGPDAVQNIELDMAGKRGRYFLALNFVD